MNEPQTHDASARALSNLMTPSTGLLTAALAGLMTTSLPACTKTKIVYRTADGGAGDDTRPDGGAEHDAGGSQGDVADAASAVDAGSTLPTITKEIKGPRTYASLVAQCDQLGGMIQLHASCGGSNSCKGFSYGDWGDASVLTEHTCAAMNACGGLSCVQLPADSGKSGKEVYNADLAQGGPQSCLNCHAVWNEGDGGESVDGAKFKVWVTSGSTRSESNWLDLPAKSQEGIVAFGRTNSLADGTAVVSMAGYHKLLSRAEIERVVAYVRTLTPVVRELSAPK
jgi:hypothetical protein